MYYVVYFSDKKNLRFELSRRPFNSELGYKSNFIVDEIFYSTIFSKS